MQILATHESATSSNSPDQRVPVRFSGFFAFAGSVRFQFGFIPISSSDRPTDRQR